MKHDDDVEVEYMETECKRGQRKKQAIARLIFEAWMHRR
jgi:hypothetical protein